MGLQQAARDVGAALETAARPSHGVHVDCCSTCIRGDPVVWEVRVRRDGVVVGHIHPHFHAVRAECRHAGRELAHASSSIVGGFSCAVRGGVAVVVARAIFVEYSVDWRDHENARGRLQRLQRRGG